MAVPASPWSSFRRASSASEVAREGLLFADFPVEGVEGGAILEIALAQQGAKKARGGIGFVLEFLGGGAAGVHHEHDGERLLGLVFED